MGLWQVGVARLVLDVGCEIGLDLEPWGEGGREVTDTHWARTCRNRWKSVCLGCLEGVHCPMVFKDVMLWEMWVKDTWEFLPIFTSLITLTFQKYKVKDKEIQKQTGG